VQNCRTLVQNGSNGRWAQRSTIRPARECENKRSGAKLTTTIPKINQGVSIKNQENNIGKLQKSVLNQSRLAKNAPVLRDLRKAPVGAVLHLHVASFGMTHSKPPRSKLAQKMRVTRSGRCGCYTWAAASAPEQYAPRCRLLTPTQSARAALCWLFVCAVQCAPLSQP
jgi:hypothetical protein